MDFNSKFCGRILFLLFFASFACAQLKVKTEVHLLRCKDANIKETDTLELPADLMSTFQDHKFKNYKIEPEPSKLCLLMQSDKEISCVSSQRLLLNIPSNESRTYYGDDMDENNYLEFTFTPEGILTIKNSSANLDEDDPYPSHFYTYHLPTDFCIQKIKEEENNMTTISLLVCNMQKECPKKVVGNTPPCIRKCCSNIYEVLAMDKNGSLGCYELSRIGIGDNGNHSINSFEEDKPFLFESIENEYNAYHHASKRLKPKYFTDDFLTLSEDCVVHTLQLPSKVYAGKNHYTLEVNVFHLEDDGRVSMCIKGNWISFEPEDFCIDALQNFGLKNGDSGDITSLTFIRCDKAPSSINAEDGMHQEAQFTFLYTVTVPIACFFLFLVILVYILLWDKQNIHGYTIFFYVISLFFFYVFIVIGVHASIGTYFCKYVAILGHFSVISTFSWLTTVGFNIWRTFREVRMTSKSDYLIRLSKYGIFSWSIPLVIVIVGLILDSIDSQNERVCSVTPIFRPLSPQYGKKSCTVIEEAQGVYMYYIAGILLGCNLIFYYLTVLKLHQHSKETASATQGDQSVFWLFGKLFIVMGICWIFEFIGWTVKSYNPHSQGVIAWFIWCMDIVVVLQAFALFIIFVCKRTIFDQLWEKYPKLRSFLSLFAVCGYRRDVNTSEYLDGDTKATLNTKETSHVTIMDKNTMKYTSINKD